MAAERKHVKTLSWALILAGMGAGLGVSLGLGGCEKPVPTGSALAAKTPASTTPGNTEKNEPQPQPDSDVMKPAQTGLLTTPVQIGKETFKLEIAADDMSRFHGLSGRTEIPTDGGMIFVFPDRLRTVHSFVMRDCPIPIDILYTDSVGRVVSHHAMVPDPPRGPGEGRPGELTAAYDERLKRYSSKFPAQFVVELKGGTIARLGVKEGDLLRFDVPELKKLAK